MKYIITESKLEKAAINWLNDKFNNLVPFKIDEEPNYIFYRKGNDTIFVHHKKNNTVWIDYDNIWSFFESYFNMSYKQIQYIIKEWIEKYYKLKTSSITYNIIPFDRW